MQIKNLVKFINKNKYKTFGLCHGVFDLLHIGHLKHFNEAKSKCDYLIVSITSDAYVNKGTNKPHFPENIRMQMVESLKPVDFVIISNSSSSVNIINLIKPDFYFKHIEYKNKNKNDKIHEEKAIVKKNKGKTIFLDTEKYSSSSLLLDFYSKEENEFLKTIQKNFSKQKIFYYIEKLSKLEVMVFSEGIIDIYTECNFLGKSAKESHLVYNKIEKKELLGGSYSICNQLSKFVKKVYLITLAEKKSKFDVLIKKHLDKKIKVINIYPKNFKTIVKERIIDENTKHKLLGLYEVPNFLINLDESFSNSLSKIKKINFDCLLTVDYGHGLITNKSLIKLHNKFKFKKNYLNLQVNSSFSDKDYTYLFKKFDNFIFNKSEFKKLMKIENNDMINKKIHNFISEYIVSNLVITSGFNGSYLYKKDKTIKHCPAFNSKAKDKIGAGDTFYSIFSILDSLSTPEEISLLIASMAAAYNINYDANEKQINKNLLVKYVEHLF